MVHVRVITTDDTKTYDTKEDVEDQVQQNLQARFSLGKRAALSQDPFLQELGTLGNTDAATRLLDGDYEFPPGCDEATISLLREAARLRLEFDHLPQVTTDLTLDEYLAFWSTAKEATSSSKSRHHFGH